MTLLLAVIIVVHGLIHLLGFVKAFRLADVAQLSQSISKPVGLLWLLCAILFVASGFLLLAKRESWWLLAAPALLISLGLIVANWGDAKFGMVANLVILLPIIAAFMDTLPSSFRQRYQAAVQQKVARPVALPVLTERDLQHLPAPVQKYLRYSRAVGKPRTASLRAALIGTFRSKKDGRWMTVRAEQYDFFDEPSRIFYMRARMFGIPFDALHLFVPGSATMEVKLASLFKVVDAKGPEMNQGETVTLFNDMCLFAPSTLIDATRIKWREIDDRSIGATFTSHGISISAVLSFAADGALTNFVSHDRFQSTDGKTYERLPWSTPISEYGDFEGYRLWASGAATWHTSEGEFDYARFRLVALEFNVTETKLLPD